METGPRTRSKARKAEASGVKTTPPTKPTATGGRSTRAKKSTMKAAATPEPDRTVTARSLEREFDERQDVTTNNGDQVTDNPDRPAETTQDASAPDTDQPDAPRAEAEQDTAAAEVAVAPETAEDPADTNEDAPTPGADLLDAPAPSTELQADASAQEAAAPAAEEVEQQAEDHDMPAAEAALPAAEQEQPAEQQQQQQQEEEEADDSMVEDSASPTAGWAAANAALAMHSQALRGDTPVSIASAIGAARGFTPAGFTPTPIVGLTPVGPTPSTVSAGGHGGPSPLQPFNLADALGLTPDSAALGPSLLATETPKELAFATSHQQQDVPTPEYMSYLSTPQELPPTPVLGLITEPAATGIAAPAHKAPTLAAKTPETAAAGAAAGAAVPAEAARAGEQEGPVADVPEAGMEASGDDVTQEGEDEVDEVAAEYEPLEEGGVVAAGAAEMGDEQDGMEMDEQQAQLLGEDTADSAAEAGEAEEGQGEWLPSPAVAAPAAEAEPQAQQPAGADMDDLVAQLAGITVKSPAPAALASAAKAAAGPATAPKSRAKSARILTPAPTSKTPAGPSAAATRSGHTPMVSELASPGHTPWPAPKPKGRSPAGQPMPSAAAVPAAAATRTPAATRSAAKAAAPPASAKAAAAPAAAPAAARAAAKAAAPGAAAAAPMSKASVIRTSAGSTPAAKKVAALTAKAPADKPARTSVGGKAAAGALKPETHQEPQDAAALTRPKSASPAAGLPVASRLFAPTQSSLAKARGPVPLDSLPSSASAASVAPPAAAPKPRLRSLVVVPSPAKPDVPAEAAGGVGGADAVPSRGRAVASAGEGKSMKVLRAEVRAKLEAKAAAQARKKQDQEAAKQAVDMRAMRRATADAGDSEGEDTTMYEGGSVSLSGALGHDDDDDGEEVNQQRSQRDQAVEDELVAAIGKMGIKGPRKATGADVPLRGLPAPAGRHMRFDDSGEATASPGNKTLLRGMPVPEGKHKRWEF